MSATTHGPWWYMKAIWPEHLEPWDSDGEYWMFGIHVIRQSDLLPALKKIHVCIVQRREHLRIAMDVGYTSKNYVRTYYGPKEASWPKFPYVGWPLQCLEHHV